MDTILTTRTLRNGKTLALQLTTVAAHVDAEGHAIPARTYIAVAVDDAVVGAIHASERVQLPGAHLIGLHEAPAAYRATHAAHLRGSDGIAYLLTRAEVAACESALAGEIAALKRGEAARKARAAKARAYDLVNNEGGEGYNPYR